MATGPIRASSPKGTAFPFGWDRIEKWRPDATKAAAEFGVPVERILAHVTIESGGDPRAFQDNKTNGQSFGLMQIVVFGVGWDGWWTRFRDLGGPGFDVYDPLLNLRVGASILRDFFKQHGSWDAASSCFFTGKPGWKGQDTVNGNTGTEYKRSLDALIAELAPASRPEPTPKPPAFGNVPAPAVENRTIAHNTAWDDLGPRQNRGVVLHRMIGTLRGTDAYFRGAAAGRALTDYGVGTAGTDGTADDGKILVWNDPEGRRSPWASGPVNQPYGDGAAFVAKYGVGAVNRDTKSIEISGRSYDDPVSPKAWDAIAAITAYWADRARIPWDKWPIHPETGISFVFWHQEFTIGTGKVCPGRVVMDGTDALIERVRAILKKAQTQDAAPAPEPPVPLDPLEIMRWPRSHVRKAFPDYDPNGPVSKEYKRHCLEAGTLPRFVATWAAGPGWVKAWEFSDGFYVFQGTDGTIKGSDRA